MMICLDCVEVQSGKWMFEERIKYNVKPKSWGRNGLYGVKQKSKSGMMAIILMEY